MHKQIEEKQHILFLDAALALRLSKLRAKHQNLKLFKFNQRPLIATIWFL